MPIRYDQPLMTTRIANSSHGSETVTEGIRVTVTPSYLAAKSDPSAGKYLFAYSIVIVNEGDRRAKLTKRHWTIVDADGEKNDVRGAGVIGQTPELGPGERFEYSSFCPITTPWGTMEGTFECERDDGTTLSVKVGRFFLVAPQLA